MISGGLDTFSHFPEPAKVRTVIMGEVHKYNPCLRINIILDPRDFSEVSDRFAGRLATMADIHKRGFNNPVNAAHLYRMASGAESISRGYSDQHNTVLKDERAALEIIYMADAIQTLREAGKDEVASRWLLSQNESLTKAFGMIEVSGNRADFPSPRRESVLLDRLAEAYKRGSVMLLGI